VVHRGDFFHHSHLLRSARESMEDFQKVVQRSRNNVTNDQANRMLSWEKPSKGTIKINWDIVVDKNKIKDEEEENGSEKNS
jgi:hypothetical protein